MGSGGMHMPVESIRSNLVSKRLTLGSKGDEVAALEGILKTRGFNPGPVDGFFDSKTKAALEAFQRKYGLDASGVAGRATWEKLLAVNPDKANAPVKNDDPPRTNLADRVLAEAKKHLGVREGKNNRNPFSVHFGRRAEVAWCAYFASYVYEKAGKPLGPKGFFGSCTQMAGWLQKNDRFAFRGEATPKPGDLIFFDFKQDDPKRQYTHVGMVERVENGKIHTIEGNAPDRVRRRTYSLDSKRVIGYGRP
jgi:Putative peptidoglycan binding domain/CHAP domain